jgi:hypothetical protein
MDDLFRFLLLRPATPVAPKDVNQLTASFAPAGTAADVARRKAQAFVKSEGHATSASDLKYSDIALQLVAKLRAQRLPTSEVATIVKNATGSSISDVIADPKFSAEQKLLADSLVAMKLLSDSSGADAAGLAVVAQGYDAIQLAGTGRDPVLLRPLSIADFPGDRASSVATRGAPSPPSPPPKDSKGASSSIAALDAAIAALATVPASAFHGTNPLPSANARTGKRRADTSATLAPAQPWVMTASAISKLPAAVRKTLSESGAKVEAQPLPAVLDALHAEKAEHQTTLGQLAIFDPSRISQVGNALTTVSPPDYVGEPTGVFPALPGNIRPAGIGDLLMVKQHTLRYEGGELAHVENVLKTEHLSRDTRRLERTETTILQETETTKEETRDTQSTDRFSLNRETSNTIKTDSSLKAGLSVDAKYGPFVEVKANADFATSTSTESAEKQATQFSKDVVDRSTSKLVERVLERRSVTTITEFEEKYSHGFDNTAGAGHVSGFYQWIDKVLQAQVYNYGKRLLFDVTVPEPATNFILAQTQTNDPAQTIEKPPEFTAVPTDLNDGTYLLWAKKYDATGLEPPPPPVKTVVKTFAGVYAQDEHESTESATLAIEDGYRAKYASFVKDAITEVPAQWRVFVGSAWFDAMTANQYANMAGEIGAIGFAYDAHNVHVLSASVEIFCERTERAYQAWQLKVHAAITQAYQAKMQDYEQKLSQARAAAGTVIAGHNPDFNQRFVSNELRKQCIALVTGQQFDSFGALELSPEGYAQANFARAAEQMPYVRFFEQAFEWEHIVYFFYPYFWGWKAGWKSRLLLDDVDPPFGDFLRAGAARVVFPVRPGFEAAVVHYLESGQIWNGGAAPDISGSLYVPIVTEIQEATGAPGGEQPVGDPWLVRLPTTLVRIRPHDDLPEWQKVGENWEPTN